MSLATFVRNVIITALVVLATVSVLALQRSPDVRQGGSSFFWVLYVIAIACALVVLIHRESV